MILTINTTFQAGLTEYGAIIAQIGEVVVNGVPNASASASNAFTIDDNGTAEIEINLSGGTGFRPYSMVIDDVKAEDKTITILLYENVTDISSDTYNRPYPTFFYFLDPCSYNIEYYNASSFPGSTSWYINNELISTGNEKGIYTACEATNYQLKIGGTTYDIQGCVSTVRFNRVWADGVGEGDDLPGEGTPIADILAENTTTNVVVEEYQPTASFSIDQTEGFIEECDCYLEGNTYTVVPSVTLPNANTYNITYTLFNFEGTEQSTATYEITGAVEDYDFEFNLTELGDYLVDIVITDVECDLQYNYTVNVTACDFVKLTYSDCGLYNFQNLSNTEDLTYSISDMYGNDTDVLTLLAGTSVNLKFEDIGSYTLATTVEGETTYRVIHNYCSLENCFTQYILDVFCGNTLDCSCDYDSSSEIKIIRLWGLYNTYFMKLQNEFTFNTYYTALSQTKLDELTELNQIASKIKTICDRENCTSNKCDEVESDFVTITDNLITVNFDETSSSSGCGCS